MWKRNLKKILQILLVGSKIDNNRLRFTVGNASVKLNSLESH